MIEGAEKNSDTGKSEPLLQLRMRFIFMRLDKKYPLFSLSYIIRITNSEGGY